MHYPSKVALSRLVNSPKGVSSRRLRLMYPELVVAAYLNNALWSPSYFAGNVDGASISIIR